MAREDLENKLKELTEMYFSNVGKIDYSYGFDETIGDVTISQKRKFENTKIAHGNRKYISKDNLPAIYIVGDSTDLIDEEGFGNITINVYKKDLLPLAEEFKNDYMEISGKDVNLIKNYKD